jgi:UDP-2-acetamido-3-amino-2,3-dideoxy-glucuronate N-acetyltransferase
MIHPTALISTSDIGVNTSIWQFCVISAGVKIGSDCNICAHCFIETGVTLGDRVTVKNGVQLWTGVQIESDVFIGPNVSFCNDKIPRSKKRLSNYNVTVVHSGASIGAGATILPGISIGRYSFIGAGAVVTRDVPAHAVVVGNPAQIIKFVNAEGSADFKYLTAPAGPRADWSGKITSAEELGLGSKLLKFDQHTDNRGILSVINLDESIPFVVRRMFIISQVPSLLSRGNHAHRTCHQLLICIQGEVDVTLDDGSEMITVRLNSSSKGLHVLPMVWSAQYNYSSGACLLVLASHAYDAKDYISDYSEFQMLVSKS